MVRTSELRTAPKGLSQRRQRLRLAPFHRRRSLRDQKSGQKSTLNELPQTIRHQHPPPIHNETNESDDHRLSLNRSPVTHSHAQRTLVFVVNSV
ncbi:hypothetical protein PROFUN_04897 [Planoprotostelium fungivorum]|uniref:Uncharacterized protein n=1 Tax=Planoprotostelium fungivorum TaxID=1890364 RepID=A0A2P6NF74_9EUKA|nr:hypothetical protein PROFUN_04897 [Planoprotostelium fungivorum]